MEDGIKSFRFLSSRYTMGFAVLNAERTKKGEFGVGAGAGRRRTAAFVSLASQDIVH